MRKFLTILFMTLLAYAVGYDVGWAKTSSMTFSSTSTTGTPVTASDDSSWAISSDAAEVNGDATYGIHYGSGSKAVSYLQLSTNDISGTITKIVVVARAASGTSATISTTVGGSAFGTSSTMQNSNATYTFTGNASGEVVIKLSQSKTKKALYVKSFEVTYTTGGGSTETYRLTDGSSNGSVTFTVGGNSVTSAAKDADVSLSATPNRGYEFSSWTAYKTGDATTTVTVDANNQFKMPDYDVTVVANFTALAAYNLSDNSTNGSVTFSVAGVTGNVTTAYPGETVTATATGASGYEFSSWETPTGVNDWNASGNTATFTMPSAAVTLKANFAKSTTTYYNKVTSASDLTDGQYLIVYETGGVAFNGGLETLDATSNTINVSISDNKILSTAATTAAEFTIDTSAGTILSASGKYIGRTANSNGLDVSTSATLTNTISINNGNAIIASTGGRNLGFNNDTGQKRFRYLGSGSAIQLYKKDDGRHSLTGVASPTDGGTLAFTVNSVAGNKAAAGDNVTVTVTAATGYTFGSFTQPTGVTNWSPSGNTATFTMPDADVTVTANFTAIPTYAITIDSNITGGSVSATPSGSHMAGQTITLTATPADGYQFFSWSVKDANNNDVTLTGNTFTMPASNVTVTATFSKITYTIDSQFDSNAGSITNLASSGQIGDNVTFTVTTKWGKQIGTVKWKNLATSEETTLTATGGNSTDGYTYEFTMPAANVQVSATFNDYHGTLRLAGHFNGNSNWRTANADCLDFTYDSTNDKYTTTAYFTGIDDNGYNDYFILTLDGVAKYPQADEGIYFIYELDGDPMPFNLSGNDSKKFACAPGVYDIEINGTLTSMKFTKREYTLAFNPAAGEVETGTSVSASCAQLADDIAAIQTADSGAQGSVSAEVSGDNSTWASSYEFATADVGSKTISGRAAIGNIAVTGTASYTVRKMTTPITLFHETFGSNSGSARNWSDDYSVKSGVPAVYSGITGYDVTNAKQTKNTNGYVESGLHNSQSSNVFQTASIVMGPLNVADYESLKLAYQWKPGSVSKTYWAKAYYATSSDGVFDELTTSSTGSVTASEFTERLYSLPESAEVSTLYIKVEWYTSNTNGIIDEVDLQGVLKEVAPKAYTIDYVEVTGGSASGPKGADANKTVTVTVTPDTGFACTGISVTTDDENYPTLTATGSGNSYSFDVPVLAAGSTITVTPSFATAYALTYVNKYIDINGDEQTGDNGGTVTGPANSVAGANVSVTVTPASDYQVQSVVYGTDSDITSALSFTMPAAATTVTATFAKIPHNITVVSVGGTGTVTGLPANAVSATSISFTITPDHGYEVSNVVLRYASTSTTLTADNGTYSFTMPGQDVTITVTYYASDDFELLKDASEITADGTYLIVGGAANTTEPNPTYVMGNTYNDTRLNAVALDATTYDSNLKVIASTPAMNLVNFVPGTGDDAGKWAIHTHAGYLTSSSTGSLSIANEPTYATISVDSENNRASIEIPDGTTNTFKLSYNNAGSSQMFRFYSSPQSPTYIYKLSDNAYSLADILSYGREGDISDAHAKTYTVNERLIGVHAVGNILYAKDEAASIDVKEKPGGYSDFLLEEAFIGKAKKELSDNGITVPDSYSQNNWIALVMPEGTSADSYKGKYLPASTVTGVLSNDENYELTLSAAPTVGEDVTYTKNVYTPANFVNTYWGENDDNIDNIYFVKPKVQEVANIAWAVWNGTSFVMPENCPAGSFAISDFSLNSDLAPTLETGKAYAFMAVIENGGSSLSGIRRLKSGDSPATFNIKPLNLTSSSPVTGINNVGGSVKEVKSVRVYNVAGVEQRELQPGVNIVVTTYTDGTRSTAKVLR